MKIRVFTATTMQEAMAEVRAALGADAVILGTRKLKAGGFEVQAAVETVRPENPAAKKAAVAIAREADLERRLRQDLLGVMRTETLRSKGARRKGQSHHAVADTLDSEIRSAATHAEVRDDGWVRTGTLGIVARRIRAPGAIEPDPSLKSNHTTKALAKGTAKIASSVRNGAIDFERIVKALAFHRVPKMLAADLAKSAQNIESEDAVSALAFALDLRFVIDPLPALPRRPIMLIGPPGAGKTVTAAKLASRAVLLGRGVEIVSTDSLRAGAKEQMESFCSILKESLVCLSDASELEFHLGELHARDPKRPCIIDTPGTNPYSRTELRDLRKFVRALDVEPVLVLAAGGDAAELTDTAQIFATFGVNRIIFTRIDAARRLGAILAAAEHAKLSLAQFSMTPYIGRGLSTLNPMSLSRLFLDEPGAPPTTDEFDLDTPEFSR